MNLQFLISALVQIVITALAGILIVTFSWYLLRNEFQKYLSSKSAAVKKDGNHLFQLRLQAYERMIVFIDRLNPTNLFLRLYEPGISATELQARIRNEIKSEYQHNISQQLYIETASWSIIQNLKEDTIAMVNNAAAGLNEEVSGKEISRKVLEHMASLSENPYDLTIVLIKQDIQHLK